MSSQRGLVGKLGIYALRSRQIAHITTLIFNNKPDSKRQQTTTVDYKRLINGLVLTGVASLQQSKPYYHVQTKEKPSKDHAIRVKELEKMPLIWEK